MKKIFLLSYIFTTCIVHGQWSTDPTINNAISTESGDQFEHQVVSDGSGGAIITWTDVRSGTNYDIYAQRINAEGIVQWTVDGVSICNAVHNQWFPAIISDNNGGAIITWSDNRGGTNADFDIYAQRINESGITQWTADGVPICTATDVQSVSSIVSDESGGAIIVWNDNRNGPNYEDIYAQRISESGIVQWTSDGVSISTAINHQWHPTIISDNSGGAIITWSDNRGELGVDFDIYAQRISESGIVQWTSDGVSISTAINHQWHPTIISDNFGGAIITWDDYRGGINYDIYVQRINTSGIVQWTADGVAICTAINDQSIPTILSDNLGGAIITWYDYRGGNPDIYAQYINTSGIVQWNTDGVAISTAINEQRVPTIISDNSGGAIITWMDARSGTNWDIYAQRINSSGIVQWTADGVAISTAINSQVLPTIISDNTGGAIITWEDYRSGTNYTDIYAQKYPLTQLAITKPDLNSKFIAGETDTIKWTGGQVGQILTIDYSVDNGITYSDISFGTPADSGYFVWNIPNTLLSTRAKIKLTDFANTTINAVSNSFRIKPYIITRLDENGDYIEYNRATDVWNFANFPEHMWPQDWYDQFNYRGIDPFTNKQYPQDGLIAFRVAPDSIYPDWVSWVNTFGVNASYLSVSIPVYSLNSILRWQSRNSSWNGSCFGISSSNALAFSVKEQFQARYPNFPSFFSPIAVVSDTGVKRVVNELFTHQFGKLSQQAHTGGWNVIKPNQTLNEIKSMLREDNVSIRTLTIWNNNGTGGHSILAYSLEQDETQKEFYFLFVYDNSIPDSTNSLILIDTTGNSNQGTWSTTYGWTNWGGPTKLMLEIESINYLTNPVLPKNNGTPISPFILEEDQLEISSNINSNIRIIDMQGNITGFVDGEVPEEIPNSAPLMYLNGSETPPYGYSLPTDNYSVVLNEFEEDNVEAYFFTGNKSFGYEREGASITQTDRLFFDGGVSAANPDDQTKTVSLLNLINETTQEKLCLIRSIELAKSDSVKIENPDSNKVKLISFGTAKDYDIELNYATESGLGRFGDFNVPLSANTSHTIVPVWTDIIYTELVVLVDIGNDGTIDDTLSLINKITGVGEDQGSLIPTEYKLAQNYPNPFNPTTTIQYSIPQRGIVTLKVYDVLGNEIQVLVNDERERGVYSVNFEASSLASGIYFYKLQAGPFIETKKMILLR